MNRRLYFEEMALTQVLRLIATDEFDEVVRMGVSYDQIRRLRALGPVDGADLLGEAQRHGIVRVEIDTSKLDAVIDRVERHRDERELILRLMRAGASFRAMADLVGVTNHEFAHYRQLLALPEVCGRPSLPSEARCRAIWQSWKSWKSQRDIPLRLLAVHDATGVAIGTVWHLVKQWERTGDWPNDAEEPVATPRPLRYRRGRKRILVAPDADPAALISTTSG